MGRLRRLRSLFEIAREPVRPEARASLAQSWASLPERFRTPQQMFGRQGNPCGATIGAMPRCDFACRGCYLGEEANHVPAQSVEAIKDQMRRLRPLLGHCGNLQLTDGEVTLRPEAEVAELLRYATSIGLVPMLMTHGDSFRRRPGLLERLMVEGGLEEMSIHVDTTMRGRTGAEYKNARTEAGLNPLREEFAEMIREARRRTGRPLISATTMTVTRDNLRGVSDAVACVARNADAYKILSFQPIAQVGRTEPGLGGGVGADELWAEVANGLTGEAGDPRYLWRSRMWLGHDACNRYVHGFVIKDEGVAPAFHSMRLAGDPVDEQTIDEYLRRFGGLSFRLDDGPERLVRAASVVARAPLFWTGAVLPYFWHQVKRMDPRRPARLLARLLTGRAHAHHFSIVSHHFMSREELLSPRGRERLDLCVFRVPVGEELVSMCEVNALGVRDAYYEDIRAGRPLRQGVPPVGRPAAAGRALRMVP